VVSKPRVLVPGGGKEAFASAADLSLKGFSVSLLELPEFAAGIQAVGDNAKRAVLTQLLAEPKR